MPTSEQDLGTLSIITYDIREDIFRPIDQLDVEGLRSRSGEITKIKEVESSSQVTGAFEQEYTFEFSTQHGVPLGGYFSIILSADN